MKLPRVRFYYSRRRHIIASLYVLSPRSQVAVILVRNNNRVSSYLIPAVGRLPLRYVTVIPRRTAPTINQKAINSSWRRRPGTLPLPFLPPISRLTGTKRPPLLSRDFWWVSRVTMSGAYLHNKWLTHWLTKYKLQ